MKPWKAEIVLLLMTLIWGATFLFTKDGLDYSGPFMYLILRFGVALIFLLIFFGKYIKNINRISFKYGLVLGLLFAFGFILQTMGLKYTLIQKSAFITGLTVSITPFAFYLLSRKRIKRWSWFGVIIATQGLYIFTNPDFDNLNLGDILTLLSTFCWAFFISFLDKFTKDDESFDFTIQLVIVQILTCLSIFTLGYFIFEFESHKLVWHQDLILSFLFNGILASFVLMIVHTYFQRFTSPVKAALIFSLEPIFASIFAIIFVNEILNNREYLGAVILIIGVLTSELGPIIQEKKIEKTA